MNSKSASQTVTEESSPTRLVLVMDAESSFRQVINLEFEIQQQISDMKDSVTSIKVLQDYNFKIKEQLKLLHKRLQEIKQFAEEQGKESDKASILTKLKRHLVEEDNLVASLRKANLACKESIDQHYQHERQSLLEGGEEALRLRKMKTRQELLKTTQKLTEILERTTSRMASETEHSEAILKQLASSSQVIESTVHEHKGLTASIRQGKSALNRLRRRDLTDKLLILFGVVLFLLVVLYIIKVRLGITFFGSSAPTSVQ